MKKIIIATDFSESCMNATKYVRDLVESSDMLVDLIHVYSIPMVTLSSLTPNIAQELLDAKKKETKKLLEEHLALIPFKHRGETHAVHGMAPSLEIVDHAVKVDADLVVMALRQKFSMVDRLIGTVTSQTISKSSIPILAIPNGSMFKSSCNILVPTEQSYSKSPKIKMHDFLKQLYDYFTLFNRADVYLVHIDKGSNPDVVFKNALDENLTFIVSSAPSVAEGVNKALNRYDIDFLAIHKQSKKFWQKLFNTSITRKLLYQTRLPIFVMTSPME